jgi:hypothetical protein
VNINCYEFCHNYDLELGLWRQTIVSNFPAHPILSLVRPTGCVLTQELEESFLFCLQGDGRSVECRYKPYKWYGMAIPLFTSGGGGILFTNCACGKILIEWDKKLQSMAYDIIEQCNYLEISVNKRRQKWTLTFMALWDIYSTHTSVIFRSVQ